MAETFRGEFNQKVDGKARVSIPAAFRRVLEAGDPSCPESPRPRSSWSMATSARHFVECYSILEMRRVEQLIAKLPKGSPKRRFLERNLITLSVTVEVDEDGRIVLPPEGAREDRASPAKTWPRASRRPSPARSKPSSCGSARPTRPRSRPRPPRNSRNSRAGWTCLRCCPTRRRDAWHSAARLSTARRMFPVLLRPLLDAVAPVSGVWLDGTFGAGGYARGSAGGGGRPRSSGSTAIRWRSTMAAGWAAAYGDRLTLVEGTFSDLDRLAGEPLDGVVLDLGVSLDAARPGRARVFLHEGRPARHADEPGGRQRRRSGEHRERGAFWPTSSITTAKSAPRAGSRAPSSRRARSCRSPRTLQAGRDRRALPAAPEAGAEPPRDPQLPGDPHRGERRIRRTGRGLDGRRTRAEARAACWRS